MKHIHKILENGGRPLDIDVNIDANNETFLQLVYQCQSEERVKQLVSKSRQGFKSGFSPTLCESGVGGTYFMHDSRNRLIGVFKPQDEEMGCPNNPKGFTPQDEFLDVRRGVNKGEAAFRECAAYILDHDHFSGVPATDLVMCNYPSFRNNSPLGAFETGENIKIGSFQEFKEHDFDAQDLSPVKAARFPVKEVHKIAILDIRLFNTDRHGGNILVREVDSTFNGDSSDDDCDGASISHCETGGTQFLMEFEDDEDDLYSYSQAAERSDVSYELIPIDHGYTLPHSLSGLSDSRFEWLNWPQSKVTFDNKTSDFIACLDPHKDVSLLEERFPGRFSPESYNVLIIATLWLKTAVRNGLTAHEIGCAMCRSDPDKPSKLELMCLEAQSMFGVAGATNVESCVIDSAMESALVRVMETAAKRSKSGSPDAQGMAKKRA